MISHQSLNAKDFQITHLGAPAYAILELTYRCPARCPGCPGERGKPGAEELDLNSWSVIIEKLSPHLLGFHLSGGEAVNHRDFAAIVESIDKANVPFELVTSGLWDDSDNAVNALKSSRMFRGVIFSIHGENEQVHNTFTGIPGFRESLHNLERCVNERFPVKTCSVLGEHNKRHIRQILQFVFGAGSKSHTFQRYIGPIRQGISVYREDLSALLDYVKKIREKGLPVHMAGCLPLCFHGNNSRCLAGITHCTIDPYGNVKSCPFSTSLFGSLLSSSIKRVWKKKKFKEWAEECPAECAQCSLLLYCGGGCRATRERFHVKCDPLMETPQGIPDEADKGKGKYLSASPEEIGNASGDWRHIEMSAHAGARFKIRKESFGYALVSDSFGEVIPVRVEMKSLIRSYDGKTTLGEIKEAYGDEGLQFTLRLQRRGFVEFK